MRSLPRSTTSVAPTGLPADDCRSSSLIGRHVHQSRIERDGYSIDDVIDQIAGAMGKPPPWLFRLPA